MNTPKSVPATHGHVEKKSPGEDTLPSNFLPGLKTFNIHTSKYKHYGHLTSGDPIDKLMIRPDKKDPPVPGDLRSSLFLSGNEHIITSPLDLPSRENLMLALDSGTKSSYSDETVRDIVRLRVEQERTKQAQLKFELSQSVTHLLKEAERHGFSGDLIRKLFLEESAPDHKNYMHHLHSNVSARPTKRKHSEHHAQGPEGAQTPKLVRTPTPTKDINAEKTPGASEIAHPAGSSRTSVTPTAGHSHVLSRDPVVPTPRASASDGGAHLAPGSASGSVSGPSQLPSMPMYPLHVYPVYYTQLPDQISGPPKAGSELESLGLPYAGQKYPAVVIHLLPPQFPNLQQQQQQQQQHALGLQLQLQHQTHVQQPPPMNPNQAGRPYYYVNLLPPGMAGPMMTSQYFIPPPLPSGMVQWPTSAPIPEKKSEEEHHHPKRHRGSKNSINFMITTPKNPPAKKYNKP